MIGRVIFGGFFLYNGINHLLHADQMAGYAEAKGIPAAKLAVQGSGVLLAVGGFSLLTGYKPKLGSALITTFLAGVTPTMHAFWNVENPQARQADMINFMKNVALAGAAMIAASHPEPWPVSPAA
ncbi:MAG TPA: DoxX family protein [Vicinamibacterales bacterium]